MGPGLIPGGLRIGVPGLQEAAQAVLGSRLERVRASVAAAALRGGRRPEEVTLVAATKGVSPSLIWQAAQQGITEFGENYVQEVGAKRRVLSGLPGVRWHLIGHLQTNKVKAALELFDIIQTVDSVRLAEAISRRVVARPVPVLLEVKFGEEPGRFGFSPHEVEGAVAAIRGLEGVALSGLMTVTPLGVPLEETRRIFQRLRALRDRLAALHPEPPWHLSMGMSDDYEAAIEEGATMVRIGRAIFGERPAK